MGLTVKLTGDWTKLMATLSRLNTHGKYYAVELLHQQAQEVGSKLQDHIIAQDLGWGAKPSQSGENATGMWWYDTGELYDYLNSITYSGFGTGGTSAFIGFKGEHSGRPPISNNDIAEMNEGVHPLVAPTWNELEGEFKKQWEDFLRQMVGGGY